MAKPIPPKLYKAIEWHLHHAEYHAAVVREELNEVLYAKAMPGPLPAKGRSRHGDPTASRAARLADGTRESNNSAAWLKAIGETRCFFAGAPEGELLEGFYGRKVRIKDWAGRKAIDRKTVQARRDNIVYRCAMCAIGMGLLRIDEGLGVRD